MCKVFHHAKRFNRNYVELESTEYNSEIIEHEL